MLATSTRPSISDVGASSDFAPTAEPSDFEDLLCPVRGLIAEDLRPIVGAIDVEGVYPAQFMRRLGALGGFRQACPTELGGDGRGLKAAIQVMEEVSRDCLSTGFCTWCQFVCAWYIQLGGSEFLKREVLPAVASGAVLAGTGMSNPMKHFAGIEKIRLNATVTSGGYRISGALPWVSNIDSAGYFGVVAKLEAEDSYMMAVVPSSLPGVTMGDGGHFIALEGSSTHNAIFQDVFLPAEYVLAAPCRDYIMWMRPGFILGQTGFGLGLIASCVDLMFRSNERVGHVNCFLDDGAARIGADLEALRSRVYRIADQIGCGQPGVQADNLRDLTRLSVEARLQTSELALRASQAAMLHTGATGYRIGSVAERKLRESYFVAIVTPAMKHLKKVLADL